VAKLKKDAAREQRIAMEIIVDAHDEDEQVMGWYYYLDDTLIFPFTAACVVKRPTSPLTVNDLVEVTGMASEDACRREMLVMIPWGKEGLAVPLAQLKPIQSTGEATREAVADWHYWVAMGYQC
jgi:hypothetical protein